MAQGGQLITTNYIITELVALLTNRRIIAREQMITSIDTILSSPSVRVIHIDPTLYGYQEIVAVRCIQSAPADCRPEAFQPRFQSLAWHWPYRYDFLNSVLDEQSWELLKLRRDKGWSLVDCSSFVVMKQYRLAEAITTDRHFEQAGFTRLLHL